MKKVMNYAFPVHWERLKVLFLIMRLFSLLMLLGTLTVSAKSWSQQTKIDLQMQNSSVNDILLSIENGSRYLFIYDAGLINTIERKSIDVKGKNIEEVLDQLFKGTNVAYRISDRQVFLYEKSTLPTGSFAEQRQVDIKGQVTDSSGAPLPGVTVVLKGTTQGTITDFDGNYSLSNLPDKAIIVFSFVGMKTQEIAVTGKSIINVIIEEETIGVDEVVVTALGLKREKKALGYSIGEVKGEELEKAKETNVINSLAGRIPGLVISQTAGGPSGSARVIIRGNTELTGINEPLYVVDGVPLDNTNFGSADTWGGYDLGDGISSINPDDIENISVLKGPAASALYGSRASHGVILITTKKASGKKKLGIEFNSTTTLEHQLSKYNDIQTTYAQGSAGRINADDAIFTSNTNWGPKIDEGMYINYFDGVRRPIKYRGNNIDAFFREGITTTNTIVLNSVQKGTGVRLSYTNLENSDIVPNTGMSRNTINLRTNAQFAEKLKLDLKMDYVREDVKNRPALSGSKSNLARNLLTISTTFDQQWLKDNYKTKTGEYYDWNNNDIYNLNPYWIINEMKNNSEKDKMSGAGSLTYDFNDKLNIRLRGGGDINFFNFMDYAPYSTPGKTEGYLQTSAFNNYTYNAELLVSYKNKTSLFDYGFNVGGNIFHINNKTSIITAKDMRMREVVALQSFLTKEITENVYRKQINSVFGMANVGYKNFLFADVTLRCDNSSTLPSGKNTYMYPSVSTSLLFSEILKINKKFLSYGKIRASFAQVGSDTGPFRLNLNYTMLPKVYEDYSLATVYNTSIPNKDLKPTRTNSAEFGADLKFLNNKLGIDFTYYTQNSKDQIMSLNTSIASGYNSKILNAGEIENRGIEIALNSRLLQVKDFSWDINVNFSRNINKVKELSSGLDRFTLAQAAWLNVTVDAVVDENYGAIMGRDYVRNNSGDILVNPSTGLPEISDEVSVLGNATWDWTGGVNTYLKYKNISLSALFDIKVGADLYSMSARYLYSIGKAKETVAGRDAWYRSEEQRLEAGSTEANWTPIGGYLVKGVIETTDESGNKAYASNTKYVDPEKYWKHIASYVPSEFVFDNSYIKMREITVSYKFPKRLIHRFADDIFISFVARNPFIIYKNIKNIDPDSNYNNGSGLGLEYGSLPSRRSFGINLNIKF